MWLLSDLHKERWAIAAAALRRRLRAAEGAEREENARKRASEASDGSEQGSGHSH